MNKLNLTSIHIPTWQAEQRAYKKRQALSKAIKRNTSYIGVLTFAYICIEIFIAL